MQTYLFTVIFINAHLVSRKLLVLDYKYNNDYDSLF